MTPTKFYAAIAAWFPPTTRAYLYGLALALCAYLTGQGLLAENTADTLKGLAGALLFGMAAKNTPTKPAP